MSRRRRPVRKQIEIIAAPVLEAKGQAPTRPTLAHVPAELVDLLPPLTADARQALVDHLADVAMALLRGAGYIDRIAKESP